MTPPRPSLPDRAALFLDLDGTLLDIAPTPALVVVPPGLAEDLLTLRARLDGALAIVTGRPVEQVDALLPGVAYAVAGEHGCAIRKAPMAALDREALPPPPPRWLGEAETLVAAHPGALLERKALGFVLHFRLVPEAEAALARGLDVILGDQVTHRVLPAHMAFEVKPKGTDKGTAVALLLGQPPFAGRVPVYVGDDVTDEDGIRAARAAGGSGWRVQEMFDDAAGVRAWLAELASAGQAA